MSTASPDTWADVAGAATQRAASACEPYLATASWSRCAWYSGDRQPLSTMNSTPSPAASVAAWRTAPRRSGSRLATPGTSSSKTVVPSGTAPAASPSASRKSPLTRPGLRRDARCSLRGTLFGDAAVADEDAVEDEGPDNGSPRAAAIAAMTASSPATRRLRIRVRRSLVRADLLLVTPRVKGAWCCQRVCDFRYADDMCRLVASEHARVAG
jgi:hypothetical protein